MRTNLWALMAVVLAAAALVGCERAAAPARPGYIDHIAVSADGSQIAVGTDVGTLLVSLDTGNVTATFPKLRFVKWSPADPHVLAGMRGVKGIRPGEALRTRDPATIYGPVGSKLEVRNLMTGSICAADVELLWAWSPDGTMIATADASPASGFNGIRILGYDRRRGSLKELHRFRTVVAGRLLAWHPDSKRVYFQRPALSGPAGTTSLASFDTTTGTVDTFGMTAVTLRDMQFADPRRALCHWIGLKPGATTRHLGLLDVESKESPPAEVFTADRTLSFEQRRGGARGALHFTVGSDTHMYCPAENRIKLVMKGRPGDKGPVFLTKSNAVFFIRNMGKVIRKDLATGEETCVYDISNRGQDK